MKLYLNFASGHIPEILDLNKKFHEIYNPGEGNCNSLQYPCLENI